jgi:hypothetical protein
MMLLGVYLAACTLLVAAGLAKALRPQDTARALALALRPGSRSTIGTSSSWGTRTRRLALALRPGSRSTRAEPGRGQRPGGWVGWSGVVRVGAAAEAALGTAGWLRPSTTVAVAVAASYGTFVAFVVHARVRGGPLATCGCFGAPDTTPTLLHAALDLTLAASAVGVAVGGGPARWPGAIMHQPGAGIPLASGVLVLSGLAWGVMGPYGKLLGVRRSLEPAHERQRG